MKVETYAESAPDKDKGEREPPHSWDLARHLWAAHGPDDTDLVDPR